MFLFNLEKGFPNSSVGKESTCNAGEPGSIPDSGSSPGEGNGNPSSILAREIPWMEEPGRPDYSPQGHKELHLTEQLYHHHHNGNHFKDERSTDSPRITQDVSGGAKI